MLLTHVLRLSIVTQHDVFTLMLAYFFIARVTRLQSICNRNIFSKRFYKYKLIFKVKNKDPEEKTESIYGIIYAKTR